MNIFFDLDGTLIDSKMRLYKLFQEIVPQSILTYQDYWNFKRNQITHESILRTEFDFDTDSISLFNKEWMRRIESPDLLAIDTVFPGLQVALSNLKSKSMLHVCTARQFRTRTLDQLKALGLIPYFETVMVTEQTRSKEELIAETPGLGPNDWIIGDTGKDVQVGKFLGIKTCAVLSGFLNEKSLLQYGPDLLLPWASNFKL
jgi:phosphoglycolate phosphatase